MHKVAIVFLIVTLLVQTFWIADLLMTQDAIVNILLRHHHQLDLNVIGKGKFI